MVTPFGADGGLNEDASVRLMHHLLEHGSDGLVLAGSTGEAPTLTDAEKLRLWELAVAECGDALVVAGTGTNDTRHSVELTERATELGVDAVLVVTPYYNKPNRRGIVAHFKAVAAATDKPVIVYNIPGRCVIDIPNDLLAELAQIENVIAVKQARFEDIAADRRPRPARRQRRHAGRGARQGRHRRHPRRARTSSASEIRRMIDEPEQPRRDPGVAARPDRGAGA